MSVRKSGEARIGAASWILSLLAIVLGVVAADATSARTSIARSMAIMRETEVAALMAESTRTALSGGMHLGMDMRIFVTVDHVGIVFPERPLMVSGT